MASDFKFKKAFISAMYYATANLYSKKGNKDTGYSRYHLANIASSNYYLGKIKSPYKRNTRFAGTNEDYVCMENALLNMLDVLGINLLSETPQELLDILTVKPNNRYGY